MTRRKTIVKLDADPGNPLTADLDGWVVVDGKPTMETCVQHVSADGRIMSGTWRATPGTYHATYTDYEFVHIITGRIIITQDGGHPVEVGPGDAFAVEADFKGHWTILEPVIKHFVVVVGRPKSKSRSAAQATV